MSCPRPCWRPGRPGLLLLSLVLLLSRAPATSPPLPQAGGTIGPVSPSVTWSGFHAAAAASSGEATCVAGVNCDTFVLTVAGVPAEWAGRLLRVRIEWPSPDNDFDLFVHKDSAAGPVVAESAQGFPHRSEGVTIDPSQAGTGVYVLRVVYFAVADSGYDGEASVAPARVATYVEGGLAFSPNVRLAAPSALADGEPSCRTDVAGNHYVGAIRGVPAGSDVWYFDLRPQSPDYDPFLRRPVYRGVPEAIPGGQAFSVGADGGGDIDLAVGFGGDPPFLAGTSLVAANISAFRSLDRGATFQRNPVGNMVPVDDRQWVEAFGDSSVYLLYRTISVPVLHLVQRSDDRGLTYGPAVLVGLDGQTGYLDVDQATGRVYASRQTGTSLYVAVGVPAAPGAAPASYVSAVAARDPAGLDNIFCPVKVAADGTAYAVYANGKDVFLVHSTDGGDRWSLPVRVNNGAATQTSLMPWLETGALPGAVVVVWYGTSAPGNVDSADWQVFCALSFDATAVQPTFRQTVASDHPIHAGNISTGGLLGAANRNLLDYFQVSVDPTGAAVIAYTDDHNDLDGHVYVTRQVAGPGLHGGNVPPPGPAPPPSPQPQDGAQVSDFAQDQLVGLLATAPANSPFDITSVRYSCEDSPAGRLLVVAARVSDLPAAIPPGNWRMYFSANAPAAVLSPTGEFTFGSMDRGDMFFVRANTAGPAPAFTFGTVVRNSNGSLTRTTQGSADGGSFDPAQDRVTVKVLLARLTPFVRAGNPPIGTGSTLVGLIGEAFSADGSAVVDITRGGTQFVVPATCPPAPAPAVPPPPTVPPIEQITGAGSILGKRVRFAFHADVNLRGHVRYEEPEQSLVLVSSAILTFVQTGTNRVSFSGTGTVGSEPVAFEITAEDNGDPGTTDVFAIEIVGTGATVRGGSLTRGNIQVHR